MLSSGMRPGHKFLCLLVLYAALTLPFAAQYLWHFDSGNYAFALREYSVLFDRPQPPGFPLFIGVIKPLFMLLGDANRALVLANWLAGAFTLACIYRLLLRAAAPQPFLWSLFFTTIPLFWQHAIVAWMHAFTAAIYALLLLLLARLQATGRGLVLSTVAIAAAAGFRQEAPLFLVLPFLLAAHRAGLCRPAPLLRAGAAFAGALALWTVPFVAVHLPHYFAMQADYAAIVAGKNSVFAAVGNLTRNLANIGGPLLRGGGGLLLLLPAAAVALARSPALRRDPLLTLAAAVLAVPLAFYALVHMGSAGYLLTLLPPLLVLAARALSRWPARAAGAVLVILIAANLFYIFAASGQFSRREIVRRDRYFARLLPALRAQFDPAITVIIDDVHYRQLASCLTEYPVVWPLPLLRIGDDRYYRHFVVARDFRENHRGRFFFDDYADTAMPLTAGTAVVVTDEGLWPRCLPPIALIEAGEYAWWRTPCPGRLTFTRAGIGFTAGQ